MNAPAIKTEPKPTANAGRFVILGLIISYCTITGMNLLFKFIFGKNTDGSVCLRETAILLMVGLLCWIMVKKENSSLETIGLYPSGWGRSILWALIIAVVCLAAALGTIFLAGKAGFKFGQSKSFDSLSLWTITLVTIRAGIAEEVFMRGYIIERLTTITGSRFWASACSLIPFALLHYTQGVAGILVALVLGGILTFFYLWRRDLKSNIIAHFLVDFIPNVLIPLFGG